MERRGITDKKVSENKRTVVKLGFPKRRERDKSEADIERKLAFPRPTVTPGINE